MQSQISNFVQKALDSPVAHSLKKHQVKIAVALTGLLFLRQKLSPLVALRSTFLSQKRLGEMRRTHLDRIQVQINLAIEHGSKVSAETQLAIIKLSGVELANAIKAKQFSCEEALTTFAYRAATKGVELNIICDFDFENSLKLAREQDALLAETSDASTLPAFFGVPMTVKEHLSVKGMQQCCGYISLTQRPITKLDCSFVQILRNAGAIPFALTNVPQGLFAIESNNGVYGQSKNPHNQLLTVGGSSGGEGGAAAARLSAFGVGSDSLGSARIPAGFCGVYSFKGTGKRISTQGRIGITGSEFGGFKDIQTSIGPFASHLDDIIAIEKAVLGRFNEIDAQAPPLHWDEKKYNETNLKNVRVGYILNDGVCRNVPAVENVLLEVVQKLRDNGVNVVEIKSQKLKPMFATIEKLLATPGVQLVIYKVLRGEQPLDIHKSYIQNKFKPDWYKALKAKWMNWQGNTREAEGLQYQATSTVIEQAGLSALLESLKKDFVEETKGVDVILTPVLPFTAIAHGDGGDLLRFLGLPGIANALDQPAGVLPIRRVTEEEADPIKYEDGYNDVYTQKIRKSIQLSKNMPVGIQVAAHCWEDEVCLKIMKEIEQLLQLKAITAHE